MTSPTVEQRLRRLTDRAELTELVGRFLRSLDERRIDETWARAFFTDDIRSETPLGDHEGIQAEVAATREALGRYERTQHVGSDHVIDLDGDRAALGWNAVMTHVHPAGRRTSAPFVVGGRFAAEAVRTPAGWRFRRLAVRPVWTTGQPPNLSVSNEVERVENG